MSEDGGGGPGGGAGFGPWSSGSELVSPAFQCVPAGRFCADFFGAGMVVSCGVDDVGATRLWKKGCG